jgi:hypothetical protein
MSSLGYSDFNNGGSTGNNTQSNDGYIASKRKNKTIKAFDAMNAQSQQQQPNGRTNPKLERLRASIAKIHAASSDEDDDNIDGNDDLAASVLPTYPGSSANSNSNANLKVSPPIADAGSGNQVSTIERAPPTTNEGRTHQPMFSMSQQFGSKMGMGSGSDGTGASGGVGIEQFKMNAPSTYAAQYYKQLAPYNYNRLSNELAGPGSNDEFIEKLNYIIHLLEEQHNERTEHVTEELVLYCFLGVFIIFIVDSFARAGKYTR